MLNYQRVSLSLNIHPHILNLPSSAYHPHNSHDVTHRTRDPHDPVVVQATLQDALHGRDHVLPAAQLFQMPWKSWNDTGGNRSRGYPLVIQHSYGKSPFIVEFAH